MPQSTQLYKCEGPYLAINSGGHVSELVVVAAWLACFQEKPSWCQNEQVCQGRKSVKRFERSSGLATALYITCLLFLLILIQKTFTIIYKDVLSIILFFIHMYVSVYYNTQVYIYLLYLIDDTATGATQY